MSQTNNILTQLQSGKCLCMICKKVQQPGFIVLPRGHGQDAFLECYEACEDESGNRVPVITWEALQYGEPLPGGMNDADVEWLSANYPEIIAEWERVENLPIGTSYLEAAE